MNNKGISAVIGVILMCAITVAIACTIFVYVTDLLPDYEHIEGIVTDINLDGSDVILEFDNIHDVRFNNTSNYFTINHYYFIKYYENDYGDNIIYFIRFEKLNNATNSTGS